jgi:hypothetical protein
VLRNVDEYRTLLDSEDVSSFGGCKIHYMELFNERKRFEMFIAMSR